jgi:hypothetical protein
MKRVCRNIRRRGNIYTVATHGNKFAGTTDVSKVRNFIPGAWKRFSVQATKSTFEAYPRFKEFRTRSVYIGATAQHPRMGDTPVPRVIRVDLIRESLAR